MPPVSFLWQFYIYTFIVTFVCSLCVLFVNFSTFGIRVLIPDKKKKNSLHHKVQGRVLKDEQRISFRWDAACANKAPLPCC